MVAASQLVIFENNQDGKVLFFVYKPKQLSRFYVKYIRLRSLFGHYTHICTPSDRNRITANKNFCHLYRNKPCQASNVCSCAKCAHNACESQRVDGARTHYILFGFILIYRFNCFFFSSRLEDFLAIHFSLLLFHDFSFNRWDADEQNLRDGTNFFVNQTFELFLIVTAADYSKFRNESCGY